MERRTVVAGVALVAMAGSLALGACGDDGAREFEVAGYPVTLAGGPDAIYVSTRAGELQRLDPSDGDVSAAAAFDGEVTSIAVHAGSVFATVDIAVSSDPDLVVRLDATTLDEQARYKVESVDGMTAAASAIAVSDGGVVVGDFDNVVMLAPDTLELVARTDDLDGIVRATAAYGDVGYAATGNGRLYQFDLTSGDQVADTDVPFGPLDECGLAADSAGVWLAGTMSAGHYAADSLDSSAEIAGIDNSQGVVAIDGGALIRATTPDGSEVLTVAADGEVIDSTDLEGGECLALSGDRVWGRLGYSANLVATMVDLDVA